MGGIFAKLQVWRILTLRDFRADRGGWIRLTLLILICSALCLGSASAQDLRYLSHQAWGTEDGLPQSSVHAVVQGRDGYLWVATEGGLVRFDGVSFRTYGRATDAAFESDDICCLKVEADGSLLVGTASGWLRMHDGRFTRTSGSAPVAEPLASVPEVSGRVQALLVDREGLKWIGTRNGLQVVDPKTGAMQEVTALKGDSVLCLFEDAEGNHWVGTETSGLHVLRRLKFRSEPGLFGLAVTSVVQTPDGAMWVGTRDDGLRRVKDGVVSEPVPVEKLTSGVILCMAVDGAEGKLWVGTPDGLNIVDAHFGVRKITSADGLPGDYVRSIGEQLNNRSAMWVGTQTGMVRIPHDLVEQVLTTRNGLKGDVVGAILGIPRGVLVATSGGLSLVGRDSKVMPFAQGDLLKGAIVTAMALDSESTVWLATNDGRSFRMPESSGLAQVGSFPAENTIDGIVADEQGSLWLRMKRGIRRIETDKIQACRVNGPCGELGIRYGVADGLPTDEVVAGETSGGALTRSGEIWFPTRRGVAVVDARHLAIDTVAPPVVVERVLVDDAAVPAEGEVVMPYGRQRLTIEYAGLSFTAPSEVRYRVKLEGFDNDWVDAGTKRSATYTNLAARTYVFRVQAVNGDGVWNLAGAEVRVRVVPPFWRRWWFLASFLAGLAAILAGIYLLRLRRLRRDFDVVLAERNRMAREIHDTLTQDFVGTSVQLDIVAQMLRRGKVEAALEQVVKTRRLVTDGLDEARRSIWELRSGGAEDGLPLRLRRLAEREEWAELGLTVKVGGAVRALDNRVEREVLRVAQEALQNVKRHARATETSVDLHYSDEAVLLTIEDNGVGFRMEDVPSGHFGLMGMKERAAVVAGELEIVSEVGKGTKVRLRIREG